MTRLSPAHPLVVLDCDSTTIEDEVIELIADEAGTRAAVTEITERAMRGELDFRESLLARVATLEGTSEGVFARVHQKVTVSAGARELIAAVHARGGTVGVVSGGFHEVLDRLAADLDLDHWSANRLDVHDGKLTGRLLGPIIDAEAKAVALRDWAAATRTPITHTIAIGDGANDLEMMAVAAISVAYHAKPIVREAADVVIDGSLAEAIPLLDRLPSPESD